MYNAPPYSSALGVDAVHAAPVSAKGSDSGPLAASRQAASLAAAAHSRPGHFPSSAGFGKHSSVSFIAAPFSGGQPKPGAEFGPDAIFAGQQRPHHAIRRATYMCDSCESGCVRLTCCAAGLEAQLSAMSVDYRSR